MNNFPPYWGKEVIFLVSTNDSSRVIVEELWTGLQQFSDKNTGLIIGDLRSLLSQNFNGITQIYILYTSIKEGEALKQIVQTIPFWEEAKDLDLEIRMKVGSPEETINILKRRHDSVIEWRPEGGNN